jgi:hypothetical protein
MSTHVPAQQHAEGLPGPLALPKVWMLLTGLVLLWLYGYGISANPLTWEEPRGDVSTLFRTQHLISF